MEGSQDTLCHLGYISKALNPMTPSDLHALLEQARKNNIKRGVSGMLLYKDGTFIQLLEGSKSDVENTLNYIREDIRHHSIRLLFFETIKQRNFTNWSMGFYHLGNSDSDKIKGMNYFLQDKEKLDNYIQNNSSCGEKLKSILLSFKDSDKTLLH